MKVALAQINPTIGAFESNSKKILDFISKAKNMKADLVVFPELSLVGYPPLDLLDKDHFALDNLKYLKKLVPHIKNISAIIGYIEKNPQKKGKEFFNAAALITNGKIVSKHYKSLLPSYDVFDETRHFEPSKNVKMTRCGAMKLAISICEDMWTDKKFWKRRLYEFDPLAKMLQKQKNAHIINISASPYSFGKLKFRHELLKSIAKKYKSISIYVNQVGANDELIFDGGGFVLDEKGTVIAQCKDFEEDLIVVDLDKKEGPIHELPETEIEAVTHALTLGIQDYTKKCGFQKVIIGLSGGIDSAVVATLAVRALGAQNVLGVLLPSEFSSEASLKDANLLSQNLKITTHTLPIQDLYHSYLNKLSGIFKNAQITKTEENLQARIRGTLLMALSNQTGAMVLSTGNKSELAVGYCTLYGDMSGGLNVLSDVPKTLVYEIARFLNQEKNCIPKNILQKSPSAELKPHQKDQDTLPAYSDLDQLIKAYVEEHRSIQEMKKMGLSETMIQNTIGMIDFNEYKRRQAPPGLRISSKAFGMGRRLPIAQKYTELKESS